MRWQFYGLLAAIGLMNTTSSLPLEKCSEVCALNITLNCATNDICFKAFSNSCDFEFFNCRNDLHFKAVDAEYCRSPDSVLCDEEDRHIVSTY